MWAVSNSPGVRTSSTSGGGRGGQPLAEVLRIDGSRGGHVDRSFTAGGGVLSAIPPGVYSDHDRHTPRGKYKRAISIPLWVLDITHRGICHDGDVSAEKKKQTMIFEQYYLDCLSHASYLIGDETSGRAVVVDPQRDVSTYLADAKERGFPHRTRHRDPLPRRLSCPAISNWRRRPARGSSTPRSPRPSSSRWASPTAHGIHSET